jgi:hypothetical protein
MVRQGRRPARSGLCNEAHKALKEDDCRWKPAVFAGYQPLGGLLGEYRQCPVCRSTVLRPVSFVEALAAVMEHLAMPGQASDMVYAKSGVLLASWAREHLPAWFGKLPGPPEPPSSPVATLAANSARNRRSTRLRRGPARVPGGRRRSAVGAGGCVTSAGRFSP